MIIRATILVTASLLAVGGFAGYLQPGWAALLWAFVAAVELVRAPRERHLRETHELQVQENEFAKITAQDAYAGFRHICEAAPVFVWLGDAQGNIEYVNQAFRTFLGIDEKADWRASIHPEDMAVEERHAADLLLGIESPAMFVRVKCSDGKWCWLWAISRAQGTPARRLIGIGIDATAWKGAEQELGALVEAKQNFLGVMSHELRTPLTAILGFVLNLKEGIPEPLPEANLEVMDRVEDSANKMLGLVNEVLLFNSLENAQERVTIAALNPVECVMSVQELLQPRARALGLALAIDVTYAPKIIMSDSPKLRRALTNLVNNALKFTKTGTITIRVVDSEKHVRFSVADPGVGINATDQRHMFEPFWQARQSMVREVGGMGLGLAVCHRIIHLLGGEVIVESQLGQGSTFTIVLPK